MDPSGLSDEPNEFAFEPEAPASIGAKQQFAFNSCKGDALSRFTWTFAHAKYQAELRAQYEWNLMNMKNKKNKKGGDPAAGSPTATLWRLNPPRWA